MSDEDLKRMEDVGRSLRQLDAKQRAAERAARFGPGGKLLPAVSRNRHIRDRALIREPIGRSGAELWIGYTGARADALDLRANHPELDAIGAFMDPDALNGYVAFDKRHAPKLPAGIANIVQYIPVHGGITYQCKDSVAAVWGFDTLHAGSEKVPRTDPDFIRYQCAILEHGLLIAAELWPRFRRERDVEKRAVIAQSLFDIVPASGAVVDRLGFTALLNFMQGKIG